MKALNDNIHDTGGALESHNRALQGVELAQRNQHSLSLKLKKYVGRAYYQNSVNKLICLEVQKGNAIFFFFLWNIYCYAWLIELKGIKEMILRTEAQGEYQFQNN